jgi:hypothetical protein
MWTKNSLLDRINAKMITELHDKSLKNRKLFTKQADPLLALIQKNHLFNTSLWEEEDLARRRNVPDLEIVRNKRNIDVFNQNRNDMIELIDREIIRELAGVLENHAVLHSETAGAMIDRLSILSLKIYHMRIQTERDDVDQEHREKCAFKL